VLNQIITHQLRHIPLLRILIFIQKRGKLMGLFKKLFRRGQRGQKSNYYQSNLETGVNIAATSKESFIDYLLNRGCYELAAYQTLQYYDTCAPLSDAVDRRAEEVESIQPVVYDTKNDEFITDHPVLDLLHNPNPIDTFSTLINRLSIYFDVTGNAFLLDTGALNKPPLELYVASPMSISIEQAQDGFVEQYTRTDTYTSESYKRTEVAGKFRYYQKPLASGQNGELRHVKRFSHKGSLSALRGTSTLQSIYFDIEQFISAGQHNLSQLKRGARPSGILFLDGEQSNMLTDDQRESLKQELENYYAGSENAGRVGFLDMPLKWQEMSQSNKDMDFVQLKRDTEAMIYKRLNIPLPFVSEETMTMANRESARLDFYQDAILPLLHRIYSELTIFLMYRYPDSENLIITFDISKIPALEPRKLDQVTKLRELNIMSTNELRSLPSLDSTPGGDSILVPENLIPLDQGVVLSPLRQPEE
jgi:HK97 family phage portal protein